MRSKVRPVLSPGPAGAATVPTRGNRGHRMPVGPRSIDRVRDFLPTSNDEDTA